MPAGPGATGPGTAGPGAIGPGETGRAETGPGDTGRGETGPGETGRASGAGRALAGPGETGLDGNGWPGGRSAGRECGSVGISVIGPVGIVGTPPATGGT